MFKGVDLRLIRGILDHKSHSVRVSVPWYHGG